MRLVKNLELNTIGPHLKKHTRSLHDMKPLFHRKVTNHKKATCLLTILNSDQFCHMLSYLTIADCHQFHTALSSSHSYKCLRSLIQMHLVTTKIRAVDQLLYINSFIRIYNVSTEMMLVFLNSKCRREPCYDIIKADVERTYVRGQRGAPTKKFLLNVLSAVSVAFPHIGYIQGLNYLVKNMCQMGMSESQSFAFLSYLLKDMKLQELYINNMHKISQLCYVLQVYVYNMLPDLYAYLRKVDIEVMYFASSWFITLFAEQLPLSTVNRLWNMLLLKGWKVLIKMALAILFSYKKEIMEKQKDTLASYLRYMLESSFSPKRQVKNLHK